MLNCQYQLFKYFGLTHKGIEPKSIDYQADALLLNNEPVIIILLIIIKTIKYLCSKMIGY